MPKDQFLNERSAKHHIEQIGYNSHYKEHPDVTANYYRFRQKAPSEKADYRTIPLGYKGTKAVIEKPVIGGNPNTWTPSYTRTG